VPQPNLPEQSSLKYIKKWRLNYEHSAAYDRVVIKRIDDDADKTAGGLFIPDSAKEKPQQGEVVAVGKASARTTGKLVPLDVQVGDRVLFGKYSGSDVPKTYGDDYLIMREDEILGVLEGAGKRRRLNQRN